jgi:hypothetical protein
MELLLVAALIGALACVHRPAGRSRLHAVRNSTANPRACRGGLQPIGFRSARLLAERAGRRKTKAVSEREARSAWGFAIRFRSGMAIPWAFDAVLSRLASDIRSRLRKESRQVAKPINELSISRRIPVPAGSG